MTRTYTIVGLTVLLAVAGCKEENPRLAVGDNSCTTSEECGENRECVLGECQDVEPDCTTDDDCEDGESCVAGVCDGRAEDCESADDCDDGEICTDGVCVPGGPDCETDDDCEDGLECINDTCVDTGIECQDSDDCDEGQLCQDGVCVPDEGPDCESDDDCEDGQYCDPVDGVCVDAPDCETSDDCEDGQACRDGSCIPQICEPNSIVCDGNELVVCDNEGLAEDRQACADDQSCVETDGAPSCVTRICEPGAVTCADALTISTCDETGTLLNETACEDGFFCDNGACEERMCEPFEVGCLDDGTAFACDGDGRIEALPCGDGQYCLEAQCFDRVCEPAAIACEGNTLVACDELGATETRTNCDRADDCVDNPLGCVCTGAACEQRVCEADTRRCIANSAQVCDEQGLGWSEPADCGDDLCVEGVCLDVVCAPGTRSCDGETLLVCNDNGTEQAETDCEANDRLCDPDTTQCVPRACDPGSTVCNGDTVFTCNERGDAFEESEVCSDGERCRGGVCRDTCEPGATRCNGNVLFVCLDDGLTEESRDCGDQAVCIDDTCVPRICDPGTPGCAGSVVTACNDTGTAFERTDEDCADDGLVCDGGACVRENLCPTTVAEASSEGAGVGTRENDIVTLASAGIFLDGRRSNDDTAVDRVNWEQIAGPDADIEVGDDVRTANVTGLEANQRYEFRATAVDEDGLEACESATVEVFTVSDDYMVVHLTWQDPGDQNQNDNQGADVDLHLLKAEEGLWVRNPFACYYSNTSPEWGPEDPEHLGDDTNGRGPEIIVMDNPADCQWYAVGAHYFRQQFGDITLGVNVFLDGQLAYSSYDQEMAQGQFVEAVLIHHPTGEIFPVGSVGNGQPAGQRPTFTEDAIDSGLCGIPDDVIPPSCEDDLGDISAIERAGFLQGYDNLSVCAGEPDYFEQVSGAQYLLAQLTTGADGLNGTLVNPQNQRIATFGQDGSLRAAMPDRGSVYVRVSTNSDTPIIYDIDAVECEEDQFDDNHTQQDSAEVITGMEPDLAICGRDGPDWFHTDLEIGDSFTFTVTQDVNLSNVHVVMIGPDNSVVDENRSDDAQKVVSTGVVAEAGRYHAVVSVPGTLDAAFFDIAANITRAPVGIDLSPVDLDWTPETLQRGSSFALSATVANLGARGATFSNARVFLRNDGDEFDLEFPDQNPFPAQSVRTDTYSVEVPDDLDSGNYQLCFEVDEGGDIPEVNEGNNVLCESAVVSPCVDPYEPNANGQEAVSSGADWVEAADDEIDVDLCPRGDQDWFYADARGTRTFCVEGDNNQTFFNLTLQVGDRTFTDSGTSPCVDANLGTNERRVFLRVIAFNGGARVPYNVTFD